MHKPQFFCLMLACSSVMAAQTASHPAVVARIVVTNNCYDHDSPTLTAEDVIVTHEYKPVPITALLPLRGARADLQLYVLVDNSSNGELRESFADLRKFLTAQRPATSIGVAYIQDGRLEVAQEPTHDRARAMQALSPPSGSAPSSPFRPLAELIEGWHEDSSRHVVLMISNGVDPGAASGQKDASVETALQVAQRAGVTVYTIYHPGADYLTIDYMTTYSGQVQLAHLATETGGEAYFQGLGPLPSFAPFLTDIDDHLANQYLLEFVMNPETRGTLQDVSVKSKIGDVNLSAPWRVWVPAPPTLQSKAPAKRQ
jgi:hypothetical protein